MVAPIYIFIVALGLAFLLPLLDRISRGLSYTLTVFALAFMAWVPGHWFIGIFNGATPPIVYTAGLRPPMSIMLRLGLVEAVAVFLVNLVVLLSVVHMYRKLQTGGVQPLMLLLVMAMGMSGMVMTRDLFNLFVFIEITSIATYGLIALDTSRCSLSAGFKYAVAGGIASLLFLLGTIYIYRYTGTLWLDQMTAHAAVLQAGGGFLALFVLLSAVLIELKPYPANGWALDVYQTVHPALAAIISAASSGAMLMALYKLLPLLPGTMLPWLAALGVLTFVASNLGALRQESVRRMLGYSSVSQIGLLIAVMALYTLHMPYDQNALLVTGGMLFISHLLAKAGLFWLADVVDGDTRDAWAVLRSRPDLVFVMGVLLLALAGLPPFPGFWGKWTLVMDMLHRAPVLMGFVLLGTLVEAFYLFRWFGRMLHAPAKEQADFDGTKLYAVTLTGLMLVVIGLTMLWVMTGFLAMQLLLPLLGAGLVFAIDRAGGRWKGMLVLALSLSFYVSMFRGNMPENPLWLLFSTVFMIGGALLVIATMRDGDRRPGFYPLLMLLLLSLGTLTRVDGALSFFIAWEWMTISSWLLLLRSKGAEKPALSYLVFSLGAATLLLVGFALAAGGAHDVATLQLWFMQGSPLALVFIMLGFLVKSGAVGVHTWLPGAYTEADDDLTPFFSALLSKAPIFGLMIFAFRLSVMDSQPFNLAQALGWVGTLTAFFGTLMAVFQEDIKKLLAYSSMGQIGYIILCVALYTQIGWVAALYLVVLHVLFKGLLFLAASGVIRQAGTRNMYQMGGLIKRMPLSFVSVLMAIIALSGVPPLAGFGSKWLIYNALLEKGWYLQAGVAFFSSAIAFLYLFRLIHAMFLGQLKTRLRTAHEASTWTLLPQYVILGGIMAFSMFPRWLVGPIELIVSGMLPGGMQWEGGTLLSRLGYWNGSLVMNITMVVFGVVFLWLLLWSRKVQKVGQFNIVYAAEEPDTPETTHAAYNFYPFYRKALGFLIPPTVTGFWQSVGEWTSSLGSAVRQVYTGNAQTYALQIVLYVTILYFLMGS